MNPFEYDASETKSVFLPVQQQIMTNHIKCH